MKKLCLGTWQFEKSFNKLTSDEAIEIVKYAKFSGISCFDTALAYGNQEVERTLAKAISKEDFVITKIPAITKPPLENALSISEYYPIDYVDKCIESSKQNLGRMANVILLHNWSNNWDDTKEANKLFSHINEKYVYENNCFIGISLPNGYGSNLSEWLIDKVSYIMAPYNDENTWIKNYADDIHKKNVKLLIRSIFNKGDYFKSTSDPDDKAKRLLEGYKLSDYLVIGMTKKVTIDENIKILKEIADE